jgi:hypothetical protein
LIWEINYPKLCIIVPNLLLIEKPDFLSARDFYENKNQYLCTIFAEEYSVI